MEKLAVVGAGFIGRSWSILFARAGYTVSLYDRDTEVLGCALAIIDTSIAELVSLGLLDDATAVRKRISISADLAEALTGAVHIQEAVSERLEIKQAVFAELDQLADADTVIASSSSTIPTSQLSEPLAGRVRCLLAHPLNPPHLVPVVEVVPTPWTAPEIVERTRTLLSTIGQMPVVMKKEVPGFIVNRLQIAVLNEAFRLIEDDCIDAVELDKAMTHGLGLRWSVVGPFDTIDLNAARGVSHYVDIFGEMFYQAMKDRGEPRRWSESAIKAVEEAMRARLPVAEIPHRQAWRDRKLAELAVLRLHSEEAEGDDGE